MKRNTDDRWAREAIVLVIEAVRTGLTDTSRALELLDKAQEIAERIDAPRGQKKAADDADHG